MVIITLGDTMKFFRTIAIAITVSLLLINPVFSQSREQSSVESVYLETNEDMIISEMAASENYEAKLLTLQYIREALDSGRSSPAIETALHSLAGEGVLTEIRTANHLSNNYTEVRRQAALMLADIPTTETKDVLLDLVREENEPMVLSAAIYSLGEIGINESDDVINAIAIVHRRFAILNPTDSLANAVLDAFEKLYPTVDNPEVLVEILTSIATNYNYVIPVRQKAQAILLNIKNS